MKKIIIILIFTGVLISCNKENNQIVSSSEKIEQIKSMTNVSERIVAFNMLSDNEKAIVWKSHLEDAINEYTLNENQLALIKESINTITPEIYNKKTKDKYNGVLSVLSYKAQKEFSKIDYARIFHSLSKKTQSATYNEPGGGDCACASNAYCLLNNFTVCNKLGVCTPTETGCGFFGTSSCTGICGNDN